MMARKNLLIILVVAALALAFAAGCASVREAIEGKKELTPAARYYDALVTFNDNVRTYNAVYNISSPETKAKWKAEIDPLILLASDALDKWKAALNTPNASAQEQAFMFAKDNVINLLISSGIIRVEDKK